MNRVNNKPVNKIDISKNENDKIQPIDKDELQD